MHVETSNGERLSASAVPFGSGPLDILRMLLQRTPLNSNLRFEALESVQWLRDRLDARDQSALEYLFAAALIESCFASRDRFANVHLPLVARLRTLDRRQQDFTISADAFDLVVREPQLQRFTLIRSQRVTFTRACHLAQALDCDGPSSRSREKDELFVMLTRVISGSWS